MEKEIKLIFKDENSFKKIRKDILKNSTIKTIKMSAVYYDTQDGKLRNCGIAIRTRRENENIYLTVKSIGSAKDGIHLRKEWNVLLKSEKIDFDLMQYEKIESSDSTEEFMQIVEGLKTMSLTEICRTDFTRIALKITDGKNFAEIALDDGNIISGEKSVPIRELEIELTDGSEEYIEHISCELSNRYALVREDESKYARGLALYLSK